MCNNAPIDDTNMMHIIAAVGRELRFPLDTDLLPIPGLNPDNYRALFKYFLSHVYELLISNILITNSNKRKETRTPQIME